MIITLSGITGTGKSFFKNQIVNKLGFKNLVIVTTREKRQDEINGVDKYFVTDEQFDYMKKEGKILSDFEFLGYRYAYRTEDVLSNEKQVTEMHYEYIEKLRKCTKDVLAIYIIPSDFERAKQELIKRNLEKSIEKTRIKEMEEQKILFENNKSIRSQFDIIFKNDYTEDSISSLIKIIKERI